MKKMYLLATVVVLLVTNAVSFYEGYSYNDTKNYEAACLQADFIRYLMSWEEHETGPSIGAEIEESWYEWYTDLPLGNYGTKHIKDIKDFEKYSWSY